MLNRPPATRDSVHQLFDSVDAISVQGYDQQRRVIYWNRGSEILYGYSAEEALGKTLEQLIIPDNLRDDVIAAHREWLENDVEIPAAELTLRDKYGQDVNVFSSHAMFVNELNEYEMYCIDINLADVKQAEAQAMLKESLLTSVFEATPDLFFLLEEDGTIINYHSGSEKDLYTSPAKFLGKNIAELFPAKVVTRVQTYIAKAIGRKGIISFEYELEMPKGKSFYEARVRHIKEHKQMVVMVRDITEKHLASELIRKQAYYDALTSLPNRFLSLDRLSQVIKDAERYGGKAAVLFLDIDDFKKVNDSLGHEVGDKLLVEAAKRLSRVVRETDTVGRLGGDEFIVLLRSLGDYYDLVDVVKSILREFREPFLIDARELVLTTSIGVAVYPENGDSATELLRNADTAMYQAKASGRNTYSFFTYKMNDMILRRLEIEGQLRGALERHEFEVYYQPKLDLKTGSVTGAEALLRWHNPALGQVGPDEFIPVAEHIGIIIPIGKYVLEQALSFLLEWRSAHQQEYAIAVNLSPLQFRDRAFVSFVEESLAKANVSPECLEFEITEGVLMIGKSYVEEALSKLHKLGVKLSMDDFGTGYSSLSYLRQYAFDLLKIDRSFISGICEKKEDRDLVTAAIAMAHSLDLRVIAEGVETQEQLSLLADLGCDIAQGYYFSKPMPANEMIKFRYDKSSE